MMEYSNYRKLEFRMLEREVEFSKIRVFDNSTFESLVSESSSFRDLEFSGLELARGRVFEISNLRNLESSNARLSKARDFNN